MKSKRHTKILEIIGSREIETQEELAEAFLAMMKLMSLRQVWIADWKPNWKDGTRIWCIISREYKLEIGSSYVTAMALSFPTEEMAKEFMNCFKDLLEVAKPLI